MGAEDWNPKCAFPSRLFSFCWACLLTVVVTAWTSKPIKQDVVYEDVEGVQSALRKLEKLPPLVTTHEVCPPPLFLLPVVLLG
jgi:3-deoxy-D-arabino-heptulosonate 7-phosphate (DAHP) synthase class II